MIPDENYASDPNTSDLEFYKSRLGKALGLLRQWRDKHGGKEHYTFNAFHGGVATGSPTDLLRDTQKFLEGK